MPTGCSLLKEGRAKGCESKEEVDVHMYIHDCAAGAACKQRAGDYEIAPLDSHIAFFYSLLLKNDEFH